MLTLLQRLIALALILSLLHSYAAVSLSAAMREALMMGSIFVAGEARVNGRSAFTGGTLFSDSTIDTAPASRALLRLENKVNLELAEETSLRLSFYARSFTGELNTGLTRVAVPAGISTDITASDVSLLADSSQASLFSVKSEKGVVTIRVEAGELKVTRGKEMRVIRAGDLFSTAGDSTAQPPRQQNLSGAQKFGLALGIGGAIALIALLISGQSDARAPAEQPCIAILSGESPCR